jgi:hypothetical protein
MKSRKAKLVSAAVGGSSLVAMGVLTVVFDDASAGASSSVPGIEQMTLGATATSTTPPKAPATELAVPAVKAPPATAVPS